MIFSGIVKLNEKNGNVKAKLTARTLARAAIIP